MRAMARALRWFGAALGLLVRQVAEIDQRQLEMSVGVDDLDRLAVEDVEGGADRKSVV